MSAAEAIRAMARSNDDKGSEGDIEFTERPQMMIPMNSLGPIGRKQAGVVKTAFFAI